jgi:hypothetical protein
MTDIEKALAALPGTPTRELRVRWRKCYRAEPPVRLSRDLLIRGIAYKFQEHTQGGLSPSTKRKLRLLAKKLQTEGHATLDHGLRLKPGVKLVREWHNRTHTVIVRENGFDYDGRHYRSLSQIAQAISGAHWSGPRFFGLRNANTSANGRD